MINTEMIVQKFRNDLPEFLIDDLFSDNLTVVFSFLANFKNSRNKKYQFWRQNNQPQELYSAEFIFQKVNYIHNNPVEAGIVEKPEHFLCSSAKGYFLTKKCGFLDLVFL